MLLRPVLEIVKTLRLQYNAIEVFGYGPTREESHSAVMISTHDNKQSAWNQARGLIGDLLESNGADLDVLIIESSVSLGIATPNMPTKTGGQPTCVYSEKVSMGSSIGVEKKGEGTFGGYLRLRDPNSDLVMVVGLTNYHIIRGSSNDWPAGE